MKEWEEVLWELVVFKGTRRKTTEPTKLVSQGLTVTEPEASDPA